MNEDSLEAVREELEKATPEISEKILADLDKLVAENTRFVKMEILNEVKEELKKTIQASLEPFEEKLDRELPTAKTFSILSMGLTMLALFGVIWLLIRYSIRLSTKRGRR